MSNPNVGMMQKLSIRVVPIGVDIEKDEKKIERLVQFINRRFPIAPFAREAFVQIIAYLNETFPSFKFRFLIDPVSRDADLLVGYTVDSVMNYTPYTGIGGFDG